MIIENQKIKSTLKLQNYNEDIIIRNCTLGSSVFLEGAHIRFTNCKFNDTVRITKGSDVEIVNCKFDQDLNIESEKTTIRNSVFYRGCFPTFLYGSNGVSLEKVIVRSDSLSIKTSTRGSILVRDSLIDCPTVFYPGATVRVVNSRLYSYLDTEQSYEIVITDSRVILENSELIFPGRRKNEIHLSNSILLLLNSRIISDHFVTVVPKNSTVVFISDNEEYITNKVLYLFSEQAE